MLYVFLVNTGTMMTFDMEFALETVENLRLAIFKEIHIDPSNQVLLISGGDSLYSRDRVCKYTSAGTDTSPIFLFSKTNCDLPNLPESTSGEDMSDRVESCIQLESNLNTVHCRTEMAHQLFDSDKSITHACEKLLHDQHLQHQGWASVVCNLDDITESFTKKANMVVQLYKEVLKNQAHYHRLLDNFDSDKENLKRIPLLKSLELMDDFSDCDEITLFDWIQRKDHKTPIDDLFCRDELTAIDQQNLDILQDDIHSITRLCNNPDMKEIRGLDVRLSALDKLMAEAKKLFEKQGVLNKTFNQNQSRASGLNDPSVLPDLCRTHKEYLESMLKTHRDLIDYRNRFHLAKRELSDNLHKRLQWIIHVEEKLKNGDEGLMKVGFRLTKIREKLDIIQNLHLSPEIYLSSISEVLRRKQFSTKFFRWAQETSEYARKIVESEICQRRLFTSVIDKHFTKWFFPGMNDLPMNFAEPPVEFDKFLPQIKTEDLDYLVERLPDMKRHLKIASTFEVPQFDIDRSSVQLNDSQIHPKLPHFDQETITSILGEDLDELKNQRNEADDRLRDKEKEVDDYRLRMKKLEYEMKANRSFIKTFFETHSEILASLQTLKDELNNDFKLKQQSIKQNFDISIKEIGELLDGVRLESEKSTSSFLSEIEAKTNEKKECLEMISQYKSQLKTIEEELEFANSKIADNNNLILSQECQLEQLRSETEETKQLCRQKVASLAGISEQIKSLKEENEQIKDHIKEQLLKSVLKVRQDILKECDNVSEAIQKYQDDNRNNTLETILEGKKKEIEQVKMDHKNEIESLKHRFKLAINTTSIHRTESETSLEKVQLDIVDHSAVEKEMQKLSQALHEKKIEYEQSLLKMKNEYDNRVRSLRSEFEQERMNSSIMVDGQEQIIQKMRLNTYDNLWTNILSLIKNSEPETAPEEYQQKFQNFKQLVTDCSKSLEMITNCSKSLEMITESQSFIALPSSSESATQPMEWFSSHLQQLSSGDNFTSDDRVNLNSCEIGDNVFVHFHPVYQQFAVFQKNSYLHFVHSDSIREFEFVSSTDDSEWFIAKVLEKEFCMTKKAENRYKLPLDTKFFRVRVKQLTKFIPNKMFECFEQAFNMSQSIATSTPSMSSHAVRAGAINSESSEMSQSVNIESTSKKTF